jgi:DNA polymerase I-like protein with 3'-5' exonuclease and polymerase domains
MIVIDTECYDPNLHTIGDGSIRGDGACIMIGLYDGKDYVCCRPDDPRLADWLASDEEKCFHNACYDLAWLILNLGFKINGTIHDTMMRCCLVDEYMPLDLDSCCKKFKVKGKNFTDTLEAWFEAHKKQWGMRGSVWNNLDVVSAFPEGWSALERYNRQDCKATYDLFVATESRIHDVREIYDIECKLWPHWIAMRRLGVRVDLERMERFEYEINRLKTLQEQQMYYEYHINGEIIASPKKMTLAMNGLGIHSPNKTATGAESWDVKALPIIEHPVIPMILNFKNLDYLSGNKGIGKIRACLVGDRLHTVFKPTRRDEGGALSARLSSSAPNLQNWPSREEAYGQKAWGPEIRSLILPEEGQMLASPDYGQIETRIMAHYAVGPYAQWFRDQCNNPKIDMHALAMERTGIDSRYIIKRLNFGVPYGMGIKRMVALDYPMFKRAAAKHGVQDAWEYGDIIYQQFKTGFPVLFDMIKSIENTVKTQGYILSTGGRKHHAPRPSLNKHGSYSVPYYQCVAHVISGCQRPDMKIHTDKGLLRFDELPQYPTAKVCIDGQSYDFDWIDTGLKHCWEIVNSDNNSVVVSDKTPIVVFRNGMLQQVNTDELVIGDIMPIQPTVSGGVPVGKFMPKKTVHNMKVFEIDGDDIFWWYLLGYIYGDGGYFDSGFIVTGNEITDRVALDYIMDGLLERGIHYSFDCRHGGINEKVSWRSAALLQFYKEKVGFEHYKTIAPGIFKLPIAFRRAIIQGMMDSDGTVTGNHCISWFSKTESLAKGFVELCASVGLVTALCKAPTIVTKGYKVFIRSSDTYAETIGFSCQHKAERLERILCRDRTPPDCVLEALRPEIEALNVPRGPNRYSMNSEYSAHNKFKNGINRLTHNMIKKIFTLCNKQVPKLAEYQWTIITGLNDMGVIETNDIHVYSEEHLYLSWTGMITHNSAADVLKKGILTAYEHGIFNELPMHLTVHDENVVSMPFNKHGFQALEALIEDMRGAYAEQLSVPLTVSCEVGANWGYWSKDIFKEMKEGIFAEDAFQRVYAPQCKDTWWCIQNGYTGLDGKLAMIEEGQNTQ